MNVNRVTQETTVHANHYDEWAAHHLKDFGDYAESVEYVNQEPDYGDSLSGEWYYGDDDNLVIYEGTFGNDHSPGSDHHTVATIYPDYDGYRERMADLESQPEYLDSEEDDDND